MYLISTNWLRQEQHRSVQCFGNSFCDPLRLFDAVARRHAVKIIPDELNAGSFRQQPLDSLDSGEMTNIVLRYRAPVSSDRNYTRLARDAQHFLKLAMNSRYKLSIGCLSGCRIARASDKCSQK